MKNILAGIKEFILKRKLLSLVIVGAIALTAFLAISSANKQPNYASAQVSRGNLRQIVSLTGKVNPENETDLSFEKSGKLRNINASVGQTVSAGQTLAALENSELSAQLNQSLASLEQAQIKLIELQKGARPEEVQIYQTKVDTANNTLQESRKTAVLTLKDTYTQAEDAIRNKVSQIFELPYAYYPSLKFSGVSYSLEQYLINNKDDVEILLDAWKVYLLDLNENSDLELYFAKEEIYLATLREFAEKAATLTNSLSTSLSSVSLTQATIDKWKADMLTARNTLNSEISTLTVTQQTLSTNELALKLAQDELLLKSAGPTQEQILTQESQIKQLQASVDNIRAQIAKTVLAAPMNGVVTKVTAELGEIIQPGTVLISLISDKQFEIEANLPEVELAKVAPGNQAAITLDAYGDSTIFAARLDLIDPAATVIDGVPTYKVSLHFNQEDERIKPGMTANIEIITAEKQNVLFIPQRAVVTQNGEKSVKIIPTGKVNLNQLETRKITPGIADQDGNLEIISGLTEGEKVLLP